MQTQDLSLPTHRTDVPAFGDAGHLRFFVRASPRGCSGLCRSGPLDIDAHWALHGYQSPEPCDGPSPEPPRARYNHGSLAQASREGFAFGADGLNEVGELEVPLETVLAMALRRGACAKGPMQTRVCGRFEDLPLNEYTKGWAALAAEAQAEMWRRAGAWS